MGIRSVVAMCVLSAALIACKSADQIEADFKACTDRADAKYETAKEAAGGDARAMVGVDLNHSTARTACHNVKDACTNSPYGLECLMGN